MLPWEIVLLPYHAVLTEIQEIAMHFDPLFTSTTHSETCNPSFHNFYRGLQFYITINEMSKTARQIETPVLQLASSHVHSLQPIKCRLKSHSYMWSHILSTELQHALTRLGILSKGTSQLKGEISWKIDSSARCKQRGIRNNQLSLEVCLAPLINNIVQSTNSFCNNWWLYRQGAVSSKIGTHNCNNWNT